MGILYFHGLVEDDSLLISHQLVLIAISPFSPPQTGAVEQLEQRILRQESEISNMENRNYFSLHCVQMETQLIHANLEGLYLALEAMVHEEATAHREVR